MSSLRAAVALALAIMLLLPLAAILPISAEAQTPRKGPAADRVEVRGMPLAEVEVAITQNVIDLYWFGRVPIDAAARLAAQPGVRVISASAGLTDIVLNPAPVQIIELRGRFDKDSAALALNVNPVLIRRAAFDSAKGTTEIELCGVVDVPRGATEKFRSDKVNFNPFCIRDLRFELNYVFDRERIAREVYRGFAQIKYTFYGPDDPTYTEVVDIIYKYAFKYDFERAKRKIFDIMQSAGANLEGGKWVYRGKTVDIIGIIRPEDERLLLGRAFALELVKLGFNVIPAELRFGDAIARVYGTNPIEFQWFFYTEGWGKGALDRFDPGNLAQFGSDILGYLPGWGEAAYWNYKHDLLLDGKNASEYANLAYYMRVKSYSEWRDALRKGTELALLESIRIWGFATQDRWPVRAEVRGLTVDLGAGLRSPFNCRGWHVPGKDTVRVGHLYVFTATTAWNTYRGFRDVYSVDPGRCTYDFTIWRHPFTGMPMPFRVSYTVETAGPDRKLAVPDDAIWFDAAADRWVFARDMGRREATSKVTFDLSRFIGTKWHYGRDIVMGDLLGALALYIDAAYDAEKSRIESEYASIARPTFDTIVAVRPVGANRLEVYVNFWHFEPSYIADWAASALATTLPFELVAAQDYVAFVTREAALSTTRQRRDNLPYLSLVVEEDAKRIHDHLVAGRLSFAAYSKYVTTPRGELLISEAEWNARVAALRDWFARNKNVWVSNGPFMVVEYDRSLQKLTLQAFRDPTYPFEPTTWVFGEAEPVAITRAEAPLVPVPGKATVKAFVRGKGDITVLYLVRDPETNEVLFSGTARKVGDAYEIDITETMSEKMLPFRVYDLVLLAYSTEVAVPSEFQVRLQTVPRGLVEQLGGIESSLEELSKRLAETNAEFAKRLEEVSKTLSSEVAAGLRAVSESLSRAIDSLGRATSDSIRALGTEVNRQIGDLKSSTEDRIAKVTRDLETVAQSAEGAQSNARLALIVSAINLLLLLAIAGLMITRK